MISTDRTSIVYPGFEPAYFHAPVSWLAFCVSFVTGRNPFREGHGWSVDGWMWSLAVAGLMAAKFWYLNRTYMFMDPAQYLYAAELWWDGGSLYRDFVDTNPPFVIFFSLPPVLLSRLTCLATYTAFWIYTLSLIALSLAIVRVLLGRLWSVDSPRLVHMVWFIMALTMLSPANDVFGQREHMSFVLLLPYLIATALQEQGRPLNRGPAVWIGILASCGILLKPYLAIIPCGVEIYLAFARRDWKCLFRPESLTIVLSILAYLAVVILYTPDYFRYADYAMETLWAHDYRGNLLVKAVQKSMPLVLAAVVVLFFGERRDAPLLRLLLLVALLFYIPAVVYRKYWLHHLFPHTVLCWLIPGIVFLRLCVSHRSPRLLWTLFPGLLLIGIWGLVSQEVKLAEGHTFEKAKNDNLIQIVRSEAAGRPIGCLSTSLGDCFPLVNYTGTRLAGRFTHLWPVPGYFLSRWNSLPASEQYLSPKVLAADNPKERRILKEVVTDLVRYKPLLILVQTSHEKVALNKVPFDVLAYFSQDDDFVKLFRNYRFWKRVKMEQNQIDIYRRAGP